MKKLITGFFMSFGMFCAIPSPYQKWDEDCVPLVLPCFPLVGAVVGILWHGLSLLLTVLSAHQVLTAALVTLFPFFLTGFIHLDGYMDTSDALLSRRPLEDQLRILKDPHTGAFAVIMLASLFLLSFSAVYAAVDQQKGILPLLFIPIASRCYTALALLKLPTISQSGYGALFKKNTGSPHILFLLALCLAVFCFLYLLNGLNGFLCLLLTLAGFFGALFCSVRRLGGISGDLAGHALVISELAGIIGWAVL